MAQRKLKSTCNKRKKNLIKNFILKQGKKEKTEKILKHSFKLFQKQERKKNLLGLLKMAIINMSKSVEMSTQTIKRGKKKTVVKTLNIFVSEKARFSNGYKGILSQTGRESNPATGFQNSMPDAISKAASHRILETASDADFSDKKVRMKFRY